jgi:accessory gene regulator protein AgrB
MNQTKIESLLESFTNIVLGYTIGLVSQLIIFPLIGVDISLGVNMLLGVWFTIVSLARSYFIRRYFNNGLHKPVIAAYRKIFRA